MSSKNNPEMRGKQTELRTYNGKTVKPARIIAKGLNIIGAVYESGEIVVDQAKRPLPYQKI
jgi:hypothetical protein